MLLRDPRWGWVCPKGLKKFTIFSPRSIFISWHSYILDVGSTLTVVLILKAIEMISFSIFLLTATCYRQIYTLYFQVGPMAKAKVLFEHFFFSQTIFHMIKVFLKNKGLKYDILTMVHCPLCGEEVQVGTIRKKVISF